jgi:hypothetical protein
MEFTSDDNHRTLLKSCLFPVENSGIFEENICYLAIESQDFRVGEEPFSAGL